MFAASSFLHVRPNYRQVWPRGFSADVWFWQAVSVSNGLFNNVLFPKVRSLPATCLLQTLEISDEVLATLRIGLPREHHHVARQ